MEKYVSFSDVMDALSALVNEENKCRDAYITANMTGDADIDALFMANGGKERKKESLLILSTITKCMSVINGLNKKTV